MIFLGLMAFTKKKKFNRDFVNFFLRSKLGSGLITKGLWGSMEIAAGLK